MVDSIDQIVLGRRSNEQMRELVGSRIRALRKSRKLTQGELAARAGLSRPTLSTLERGNDVSLDSFLSVLRALDLLEALSVVVPEPGVSPIGELSGGSRNKSAPAKNDTWVWGDES